MRRLRRAGLARRPTRHREPLQVQRNHQRLRLHPIEVEVAGVGHAHRTASVHACLVHRGQNPLLQPVTQRRETVRAVRRGVCGQPCHCLLGRAPQANDAGDILRAGTPPALMQPAKKHGLEPHIAPHKQRARALRRIHLVAGEAEQVAAQRLHIQRQLARALDRIRVEERARRVGRIGQHAHRLDHAGLVVGEHDADELRRGPQRRLQRAHLNQPLRCARQECDFDAALGQLLRRMQDGVVLNGCGDEVVARR